MFPCSTVTPVILLFLGNGGYGTLVWVVVAEMLPPRGRAVTNSVNICASFSLGFVASKVFVDLTMAISMNSEWVFQVSYSCTVAGGPATFWLYGGVCLIGAVFTFFCVPETKGKSIEEIQKMFAN